MTQAGGRHEMSHDGWDPAQYGRFSEQRAQPFWDLVALIQPPDSGECVGGQLRPGWGDGLIEASLLV